jgi:hypothetical protein
VLNVEVMEFVTMNELDFSFLGEKYSDSIMCRIADANIHPVTLMEFDPNFAEGLTYVPVVPIRTNSILNNARQPHFKPGTKPKTANLLTHEAKVMDKFLSQGVDKFDPFEFEYKSLINGDKYEPKLPSSRELTVPELKPIKGGLRFKESEEDSDVEESPVISEMSSQEMSNDGLSLGKPILLETRSANGDIRAIPKRCKDELDHIA